MGKLIDLISQRFGRLTVIERTETHITPSGQRKTMWRCRCDCGRVTSVCTQDLRQGHTYSCGCLRNEKIAANGKERLRTHGLSMTKLYKTWISMKQRCVNPKHKFYNRYGGRGITVCTEWLYDFETFRKWAIENGYKEGLSIDRINNNEGYRPDNCRWITPKEQCRNRSNNCYIQVNGETKTLAEWSEQYNLPCATVRDRLSRGWTPEEALGIVPRKK